MAKRRDRRPRAGHPGSGQQRSRRDQHRPGQARPRRPELPDLADQPLVRELRAALRGRPFAVVALASSLLAALEDDRPGDAPVDVDALVDSFAGFDVAETTAALHALAALTSDELLAARIRRAVAGRRQPVPALVAGLGAVRVTDAVLVSHELDDGENVILTARWPDGFEVTPVIYIDRNLGTIVKDAFVVEEPSADVRHAYQDLIATSRHQGTLTQLSLADARAKLEQAIAAGRDYEPPDEDSQWPACRPFVQMLMRNMPAGGTPDVGRPNQAAVSRAEVVAGFLASPEAAALGPATPGDLAAAAEALVGYAADHSGHPMRWSGVTAELVLLRYLPWEPEVSERALDAVPEVLPALVRYCHRALGMTAASTDDTLASIEHWLDEYQRLRSMPTLVRLRQSEAELAAFRVGDFGPWVRRMLVEELGSQAAVDALDTVPLPDEELDLSAVPDDVHALVREVAALTDAFVDHAAEAGRLRGAGGLPLDLAGDGPPAPGLAVEFRTACRRFVARVAAGNPAIFRRSRRADTAAAAVVWAVGKANKMIGARPAGMSVAEAQRWFGLGGSSSQRAGTMLRAIGVDPTLRYGDAVLGTPDLLISARRQALLRKRDDHR
jgi:hypothetical protein